ncbi:hypothetical protein D3C84_911800 [compost metagenome]
MLGFYSREIELIRSIAVIIIKAEVEITARSFRKYYQRNFIAEEYLFYRELTHRFAPHHRQRSMDQPTGRATSLRGWAGPCATPLMRGHMERALHD